MIVELARQYDVSAVYALRYAHFHPSGLAVQDRSDAAVWWVARDNGSVFGCYCVEDVLPLGQRWLLDCYAVPGRRGKVALIAMYNRILADVDRDALELVGVCEPRNIRQIAAYCRRGGEVVGIMLRRPRKEAVCLR